LPNLDRRITFPTSTPTTRIELIAGSLPTRHQRLVEAWAELHQAELANDWQSLQSGRKPEPILPLK
jgi:hypothetical protein